jgi:3-oxoacyl-[acyl-carrier-protein] synthase-1
MAKAVFVTGMGVVSAIGFSVDENRRALLAGETGIGSMQHLQTEHHQLPVGEVKASNQDLINRLQPKNNNLTRTALLGLMAAREAASQANYSDAQPLKTGIISATTVGGMDRTERFYPGFIQDSNAGHLRDVVYHDCGAATENIADELGIKDFLSTINTACSSSVNAIMLGVRLIRAGRLDRVLVGGSDALSQFTLNGFNSLMILDSLPCRPFDATRSGLNLGEGAGFLMIESEASMNITKSTALAKIEGFANTNDAFHQTASSPEGTGAQMAMLRALQMSDLQIDEIDYLNAHGTATGNNDEAEGIAISKVFEGNFPLVSSTKAFTGHTLAAAGSIESVFSILAMQEQCAFATLRLQTTMPEISFEPLRELRKAKISKVMSNSFGFGGNCSSIIFSAV